MKEYLAIFDMDGTLFDTREANYSAYKDSLEKYNISLDRGYFETQCFGKNYREFLPIIMGGSEFIEDVHSAKIDLYKNYLCKVRMNQHLFRLIDSIKDKYYVAIVTTASKTNTMELLHYFNCTEIFDCIVTKEIITKMKPDPECFLWTMSHFDVEPDMTLIFEDSKVGIAAARSAGASVFVVNQF